MKPFRPLRIASAAFLLLCLGCTPGGFRIPAQPAQATLPEAAASQPATVQPATTDQPAPTALGTPLAYQGPLSVVLEHPLDNEETHTSPMTIAGRADPGTVISINDVVILVDASGKFSAQLPLESGENLIEINASDTSSHQGFSYLTVYYSPEP